MLYLTLGPCNPSRKTLVFVQRYTDLRLLWSSKVIGFLFLLLQERKDLDLMVLSTTTLDIMSGEMKLDNSGD